MIDIQHHFECLQFDSRGGFCSCSDEHEGRKVRLTHGPCFQARIYSAGTTIFPSISLQPPTLPCVSAYSADSKSMNSTLHTSVHSRPDEEQSSLGHIIAKRGITLPEPQCRRDYSSVKRCRALAASTKQPCIKTRMTCRIETLACV